MVGRRWRFGRVGVFLGGARLRWCGPPGDGPLWTTLREAVQDLAGVVDDEDALVFAAAEIVGVDRRRIAVMERYLLGSLPRDAGGERDGDPRPFDADFEGAQPANVRRVGHHAARRAGELVHLLEKVVADVADVVEVFAVGVGDFGHVGAWGRLPPSSTIGSSLYITLLAVQISSCPRASDAQDGFENGP